MNKHQKDGLGELLLVAKVRRKLVGLLLVPAVLSLAVGVLILANGTSGSGDVELVGVGLGFVAAAVAFAYPVDRLRRKRVSLHERGLSFHPGGTVARWSDVRETRFNAVKMRLNGVPVDTISLGLKLGDGSRARIGSCYDGAAEIVAVAMRFIEPHLLRHNLAALRRSSEIRFGALTLTCQGVRIKKQWGACSLALEEITACEFRNGRLVLCTRDGKVAFSKPLAEIPNGIIVPALVAALKAGAGARHADSRARDAEPAETMWSAPYSADAASLAVR